MTSGHVTAPATWDDDGHRLVLDDLVLFNAGLRKLDPGAGERFIVRVEREADAKRHWQLKWYYGYCVKQCVEKTGYSVPEMDAIFRAECMPTDVETLSLMSYEQMRDFLILVEKYAAEVIGVVIVGPRDRMFELAA